MSIPCFKFPKHKSKHPPIEQTLLTRPLPSYTPFLSEFLLLL